MAPGQQEGLDNVAVAHRHLPPEVPVVGRDAGRHPRDGVAAGADQAEGHLRSLEVYGALQAT